VFDIAWRGKASLQVFPNFCLAEMSDIKALRAKKFGKLNSWGSREARLTFGWAGAF
jgi:hypothetical protein